MDIFSATSKQVEVATTPKAANSSPVRTVEQANTSTLIDGNSNQQANASKLEATVKELNKKG